MRRPKFGDTAFSLGYLTEYQLAHALAIQLQEAEKSRVARPLGLICMAQGYLTFQQVQTVLACQELRAAHSAPKSSTLRRSETTIRDSRVRRTATARSRTALRSLPALG